ncbi:hypothetical protein ACO0LG_24825 [Undibacterium sp. Ji42W]
MEKSNRRQTSNVDGGRIDLVFGVAAVFDFDFSLDLQPLGT